jgi:hypothetical protein
MKKGKSHEDFLELRILYFILVLGAPYYQGGALGESVKCKSSTSIQKPKVPEKTGLIRVSDRILKSLAGHVRPTAQTCSGSSLSLGYPQLSQTYSIPYLGLVTLAEHVRLLPNHSSSVAKSQPALSGFQRIIPDKSGPQLGHVQPLSLILG